MDFTQGLNKEQKQAVLHTEGPLLVLAGAGSGKTKVLTHRIAHMVLDKNVDNSAILAITFTNKAAKEMKERLGKLIGEKQAETMWVCTFHSMCVRILRKYGTYLGYERDFTIYDTGDQKIAMKETLAYLNIDEKAMPIAVALGKLSDKKNKLLTPKDVTEQAGADEEEKLIASVYTHYQKKLKDNNCVDFDDLLLNTHLLFQAQPRVLAYYQDRFQYIMVDEYQDTNEAQYQIVHALAKKHTNLCVVGDDDQSIYGWRGADIKNILGFEKDFKGTRTIKLEQNYRCTQKILEAANSVVAHNHTRKPKKLWTENTPGMSIGIYQLTNEYAEADKVVSLMTQNNRLGCAYKDMAILYRTNAQSRTFEEKLIKATIPYRLLGGVRFYERKEIKDILSYLKLINNTRDSVSYKRIINTPKRGIGNTTITKLVQYADDNDMTLLQVSQQAGALGLVNKGTAQKLENFNALLTKFKAMAVDNNIHDLLKTVIKDLGYYDYLKTSEPDTAVDRIENVDSLLSKTMDYMKSATEPSLSNFLEEVALVADVDNYDENSDSVVLMTLHSSKGLEFPIVFLPGFEDGLFPSAMSMAEGNLEEERRLCYVGITRAKQQLYILLAKERTVFGLTSRTRPSRFLSEIPIELTNLEQKPQTVAPTSKKAEDVPSVNNPKVQKVDKTAGLDLLNNLSTGVTKPFSLDEIEPGDTVYCKALGICTVVQVQRFNRDVEMVVRLENGEQKRITSGFSYFKKLD